MVCLILFAMTTTLTVIEVSQYIAFSVSRAHLAGHHTVADQQKAARDKFKELTGGQTAKHISAFLKSNWFELSLEGLKSGGANNPGDLYSEYTLTEADDRIAKTGVRLNLEVKILNMNLAFLGSTKQSDPYVAKLTGLLIREPTSEECMSGLKDNRYRAILTKANGGLFNSFAPIQSTMDKYFPMEDNGC